MSSPQIVIVNGLPGSGKSTVSRGLAERFQRGAWIEGDHLQHRFTITGLVDPGVGDDESWAQLELRWRNLADVAGNFVDAGFVAVVDSLCVPRLLDVLLARVGEKCVDYVHLEPDREVGLARDAARGGRAVGATYDYIAPSFEPLRGRGVWIDSTSQTVVQTVDAAFTAVTTGAARL